MSAWWNLTQLPECHCQHGELPTDKSQDAEVQWEERRSAMFLLSQPSGIG